MFVLLCIGGAVVSALAEPPPTARKEAGQRLRLAILKQPNLRGNQVASDIRMSILKGVLLELFEREPGVQLLDQERVDALCSQFGSPAYDVDSAFLHHHLSASLQMDVLIYMGVERDETSAITVMRADSANKRPVNFHGTDVDMRKECAGAVEFVRNELKLPPGSLAVSTVRGGTVAPVIPGAPPPAANAPDLLRSYHMMLSMAPYLKPTEDRFLRPAPFTANFRDIAWASYAEASWIWPLDDTSAQVGARILYDLHASRKQPPQTGFTQKHCDFIEGSLRAVMGTPLESSAYPLFLTPDCVQFEPTLQMMCRALLPGQADAAAVDDLFQKAIKGSDTKLDADRSPPIKPPPPPSRAAGLGALRTLGRLSTPSALATLLSAAQSADPAVRTAAATGLARREDKSAEDALRALAVDTDPSVCLSAMASLFHRGTRSPALLASLRKTPDSTFESSPLACNAFSELATAEDKPRLDALEQSLTGPARTSMIKARLRLGLVAPNEFPTLLKDDDTAVIMETLRALGPAKCPPQLLPQVRALANDPNLTLAELAYSAARPAPGAPPGDDQLFRLECGSQYERLTLLTGMVARRDIVPDFDLLRKASTNFLPIVRFESLRLIVQHYPKQASNFVGAALRDPHRWVRMQAAAIACDINAPELTDELNAAIARESCIYIAPLLKTAIAKATGAPLPPSRPAARPHSDAKRWVWTHHFTDKDADYSPLDAFICYAEAPRVYPKFAMESGKTTYGRVLWGRAPGGDELVRSPRAFDTIWGCFDSEVDDDYYTLIDGFDIRNLSIGSDWDGCWRDFCRDARIDPAPIAGDISKLNVYERRAYDNWSLDRGISCSNLLNDLVKLRYRYTRPNLRFVMWSNSLAVFYREYNLPFERWNFDMGWTLEPGSDPDGGSYLRARVNRTIWPDRSYLYSAPVPGGLPDGWVRFDSPMPKSFIYKSPNDIYTHSLLAWLSESHLKLHGYWRFIDYKTAATGLYPPSVGVGYNTIGPDPEQLEKAIEHAFADAPLEMPKRAVGITPPETGLDPEADRKVFAEPLKKSIRLGMKLMQKHLYDIARIFTSLPRFELHADTLMIEPGLGAPSLTAPAGLPPVVAARELANQFDLLPGVNLVVGRDLSKYKIIIVHNASLLRDETIVALTKWLRDTSGLLVIHQDLTADNRAESSTTTDHDGVLREDWPWEKDLAIQPAATETAFELGKLQLTTDAGKLAITADKNMSVAACRSEKAVALARVGDSVVLARWRDPAFKGAVLFDGLRSPSKPYVDLLAEKMNELAKQAVGRAVTGGAVLKDAETDSFHVVASPGYGDGLKSTRKITGIDLLSGVVDPTVGPRSGSVIVPTKDYFNRYLACTPSIVALGEREFTQAGKAPAGNGLLLNNVGVVQLAGRGKLRVVKKDGTAIPAIPFDFEWLFDGKSEGVAEYQTEVGSKLVFVRCAGEFVVTEVEQKK